MSQIRDNPPGYNSLVLPNDYEYKIDGALAIGYTDGKLWDQSSINQGLGAAKFSIVDKNNASKDISIRLEDHPEINDIGLNFCYEDSSLGTLKAYTYKEKSIMNSLRILENFGSDPNNSTHVLYEYISQIQSILSFITGTTSLGASLNKDDVKEAVFANISKFVGIIGFDNNYDFVEDNYLNGQTSIPATNTIRLNVNLSKLVPSLDEPFTIVLNFNESDESNLFTINIENLKINEQFGCFTINMINGYDKTSNTVINSNLKISELNNLISNLDKDSYVDLQDLPILVHLGIYTTKRIKYHITGTLDYSIFGDFGALGGGQDLYPRSYSVEVYLQIIDSDLAGLKDVICQIKINDLIMNKAPSCLTSELKVTSSEIIISKDDVYIKRKVDLYEREFGFFVVNWAYQNSTFNYLKLKNTTITSNLLEWFFLYILNNKFTYDFINERIGSDSSIKPFDLIKYFKHENEQNRFSLGITILSIISGNMYLNYDMQDGDYILNSVNVSLGIGNLASIKLNANLNYTTPENVIDDNINLIYKKIELFNNSEYTKGLSYANSSSDSKNIYSGTTTNQSVNDFIIYNGFSW